MYPGGIDVSFSSIASQITDLIKSGASNMAAINNVKLDVNAINKTVTDLSNITGHTNNWLTILLVTVLVTPIITAVVVNPLTEILTKDKLNRKKFLGSIHYYSSFLAKIFIWYGITRFFPVTPETSIGVRYNRAFNSLSLDIKNSKIELVSSVERIIDAIVKAENVWGLDKRTLDYSAIVDLKNNEQFKKHGERFVSQYKLLIEKNKEFIRCVKLLNNMHGFKHLSLNNQNYINFSVLDVRDKIQIDNKYKHVFEYIDGSSNILSNVNNPEKVHFIRFSDLTHENVIRRKENISRELNYDRFFLYDFNI